MNTDRAGCSTCPPGQEQYETFTISFGAIKGQTRVQYEYRTLDGQLFTCLARDLDDARARCADWLVSVAVHRSVARLSSRLADRLADQEPIRG